jgi:hypothetical protein
MAIINANFTTQSSGIAVPSPTVVGNDLLRVNDVNPDFNMLNSEDSVLYRILALLAREADATQPQFWYFEDDLNAVTTTVNGAEANVAEATVVMDDALLAVGQVVHNVRTGENMLCIAVNTAPSYEFERGYQGTTAAAILDEDLIAILPAVLEDGGAPKDWIGNLPTKKDQFVSFVSQSIKSTDLQEATQMLNGAGQLSAQYAKCTTDLMRKMNLLVRHSKKSLDAGFAAGVTTNAAYHTDGLEQLITTNTELPITGLDWASLNTAFNAAFVPTSSSMEKMLVLSQYAYSKINNLVWGHFVEGGTPSFQKTFGALMSSIQLDGGGIIHLVADKHSFYPNNLGKQGYLLDMANVGMKKMANFDLSWREVPKDEYRVEKHELSDSIALMLKHASLHRTITFA